MKCVRSDISDAIRSTGLEPTEKMINAAVLDRLTGFKTAVESIKALFDFNKEQYAYKNDLDDPFAYDLGGLYLDDSYEDDLDLI